MFDDCRQQLEKIQEDKETAIDEFLEQQTEDKILNQKVIEKKFKKLLADFDKNIDDQNNDGPSLDEYKSSLDEEKKVAMENFKKECLDKKTKGM